MGPYFLAKVFTSTGIWMHNVVAAIVMFQLTGSTLLVGAISVAQFSPQLVLAPWMGAVADRGNRRQQAIVGRVCAAVGSGALALWMGYFSIDRLDATIVILSALVVGIGFAISTPAMHALEPTLAPPSELSAVLAITNSPFTIARASGPALGILVLVSAGPATVFGIAAAGQLIFAALVWRLNLRRVERARSTDGSVPAGLSYLRHDLRMSILLIAIAGVGFGVDPVITLSPPLAASLGHGERLVAAMASAFGAGAGIMVLLLGAVRRGVSQRRMSTIGLGVLAASMVVLSIVPSALLAVVLWFVGGAGMMCAVTSLTTQIQERVPEELRGRIMALWSVSFVGSRPVAAMLNGALADFWSVGAALIVTAVLLLLVAVPIEAYRSDG